MKSQPSKVGFRIPVLFRTDPCRLAMSMGLIQLVEVAFDGTRVKANASRLHTWTAQRVEEALGELERQIEKMLTETDAADGADAAVWGEGQAPADGRSGALPPELADAQRRQEKLRELLEQLREADEARDLYSCPMGKELPYRETKKGEGAQGERVWRIYACKGCDGCPLAKECLDPKAKRGRTVTRDAHEPARERMHAKMQTAEGRAIYNRRMHIGETPFAIIKGILEVRRFLLRGLEKVRTEWRWVCTAYNLKKLVAAVAALRAPRGETAISVRG